jgi:L-fucose mutarotase
MLLNISPVLSPELLEALDRMGHSDEIVLADAFYPGDSKSSRCIRADGVSVLDLLDGILPLINLDGCGHDPVVMMQPMDGDSADPAIEERYRKVIDRYWPDTPVIKKIERNTFYERAKTSYAVVVSGSMESYGCIILRKGVIRQVRNKKI